MNDILKVKRLPRFVNVGENPSKIPKNSGWIGHRQWKGCIKYSFISAGQGTFYSRPFEELEVGDFVAGYITGNGYVGVGRVTHKSIEIKDFSFGNQTLKDFSIDPRIINGTLVNNEFVAELQYIKKTLFRNAYNHEKTEHAVGINWIKCVERKGAFWKRNYGLFASRLTQCSLENQLCTIRFIEDCFDVRFVLD